jgi:hypothetical protein
VYEPTYRTVYGYLSRLAQRGVVDLDDVVLPLSKVYIFQKLNILSYQRKKLTPLELKELEFYLKEYTLEWNLDDTLTMEKPYKSILKTQFGDRFRWATYQDNRLAINVQPIGGYEGEIIQNSGVQTINHHTWRGIWLYGYIGKNIGFSFDIRDNTELGDNIDTKKQFSPTTGIIGISKSSNSIDYSEVKGSVSVGWKWGSLSVGKDFLTWGYGTGGKVVMSQKAPSFPLIRLDVSPLKWLRFNYQHIWLNSDVIDSLTIRPTSIGSAMFNQFSYRTKSLAMHSITFLPKKGLSLSFGESAIYNDGVRLAYFIPIIFFRAIDHYSGGLENNGVSNSQIFFQFSSRNHIPKTHLYFTYFIDEIRLKGITNAAENRDQTAYTAGISLTDFPFNNLSWTFEYSKVRPFAYENFVVAQNYTSSSYSLGHWIGTNADQAYAEFLYRAARGLHIRGKFEYIRKGNKGTGYQQQYETGTEFLWGEVNSYMNTSLEAQYELTHDLFFKAGYGLRQTSLTNSRNVSDVQKHVISVGFNYGF